MSVLSRRATLLSGIAASVAARLPAFAQGPKPADTEWRHYAADLANTRYSPLDQINAANFNSLEVAWRFSTEHLGPRPEYVYEGTPLLIQGRLYCTAGSRRDVVCLDPATGEQRWLYSLDEGARGRNAPRQYSGHGVSYWSDGKDDERILYVTPGYRLVALDAKTGVPVKSFGDNGMVDLKRNDDQEIDLVTGEVGIHATPAVAGNTVIVGAAHLSGGSPKSRSNVKGYVRGYDAVTGARKWIFHTIPRKGEFGYDSWTVPGQAELAGNTGCWAQVSIDRELGLAYLPIELPTGDQVGIYRAGDALFGEAIVAVDIETGVRKWHYQLMHHGLWDRDIPCAPILCDIPHNGRIIKALAQPTKQTVLYVLDRVTGKPVWPIPEVKAPRGDVPGEWYAPTQPLPVKPRPYGVTSVNPGTIIDFTPELHDKGLKLIGHYNTGGIFEPPTLATLDGKWGTLVAPGFQGGTNWPGGCYDPETHKVFVFAEATAELGSIVPGDHRVTEFDYVRGTPGTAQSATVAMGSEGAAVGTSGMRDGPAAGDGFHPGQNTIDGLPILKPPYGAISAINLETGNIDWRIAHGETPDAIRNHPALKGLKIPRTGRPGLLGPMVTRTLVICGEAGVFTDEQGRKAARLRAYDKQTGAERGAVFIPAPQTGSPMTYMLDGRQYIVLAIGGGAGVPGQLIAFRLPKA
jgi:quinoprotein glucose dehydrogenase